MILFCALVSKLKKINCAQIMGSFSIFLRTLLYPNRNILLFFWLIGSFDCLLHFVLCKWDQFVPCALLLWLGFSCIITDSLVYIMFLSIASILCMQSFFVDTYHDYDWPLRNFLYMRKFISFLDIIYSLPATLFVSSYSYGGFGKRLCRECLYVWHIILRTHVFWMFSSHVQCLFSYLHIWLHSIDSELLKLFIIEYVHLRSHTSCDMHTSRRNSYYIGLLDVLSSILAFVANGEKFRGFKINIFCSSCCHSCCSP